ncbi:MAG: hypothetical protein L0Y44_09610 [Phycisphaerales bacterium]|nr:hypothetical protein [Phycisphaerales bacterium]
MLILAVIACLAIVVLPVVMVQGLIHMYRDKDRTGTFSSGVAGMMTGFDRVIRPSVQYVVEAKKSDESHEDAIGGE